MKIQRFNWPLWVGFLVSLFALVSYPFVFVRWPLTRDFPWANLLLFGLAAVLFFVGARRAFAPDRRRRSRIAAAFLTTLGALFLGVLVFSFFVVGRWLPAAHGAPRVGQKAPDFELADTNNKPVSLAELLSSPINGKPAKGVLLIFYRGYW
ncbi:MAG: AhpC/TSA family [Blastocatellia bacterium]|jgi:predicted PurR-regulated permease PerM|nr:AhpC/TSA family [Blastocatellia bacterium]